MVRSRWAWISCLIITLCLWLGLLSPALAIETALDAPPAAAQELFTAQCAGCHPNGGNIIRRGKTLKLRALTRNGVDSVEAVKTLITNGKGIMSAYGDRLSPAEIDVLATYVWVQAQDNWR